MESIEYQEGVEHFLCEKATINHIPISGILELTPLCNMQCEMCYVRLSPEEMKKRGYLRSKDEWIALGKEMCNAGTIFVSLTGGEPLLYPDFREVYMALKKMGMILTINTNGTLLDEDWADFFAKYLPRRINITLYGKDKYTYKELCHYPEGFQRALKAIKLLQNRNIDVKINGSITSSNVEDIEELFSVVNQMGTVWKFDTYMYPASRERSLSFNYESRLSPEMAAAAKVDLMRKRREKENFYRFARNFIEKGNEKPGKCVSLSPQCRAGRSSFAVNWQGMMRPCIMLSTPQEPVFEVGFLTAWDKIVREFSRIRLSEKCNICTMREVCQTCAACALLETGRFNGVPEYMCRYTKETLRLLEASLYGEQGDENDA